MVGRWRTLAIATFAVSSLVTASGRATTLVITTRGESSAADRLCSLREAIAAVNAPGTKNDCGAAEHSSNTIVLGPHKYSLTTQPTLPSDGADNGDLDVTATGHLTIRGAGPAKTLVDGANLGDRLLHVLPGATVTLVNLTIAHGHAPNGAVGAGGSNQQGGTGFSGGGIFNGGTLTLIKVAILNNHAGNGGGGGGFAPGDITEQNGGNGGTAGEGGGIYNTGTLRLTDVTVRGNHAGNGGAGGRGSDGANGDPNCDPNDFCQGDPGSNGGNGGCCGDGGGLATAGGHVTINGSTFDHNHAGAGGAGGGFGDGGINTGDTMGFTNAEDGDGGTGAGGSSGGAIASAGGSLRIVNSTLAANASGPGGSAPFQGRDGNGSAGGGIYVHGGGTASLTNLTIASNTVGGPGTPSQDVIAGNPGFGGGVYVSGTPAASLQNTLLGSNALGNCAGTAPTDLGHNLSFGDATPSCPAGFAAGDPKLEALLNNGGPTRTIGLGAGSAALNQVPASGAGCPTIDQRGVARPAGSACEIGAFELAGPRAAVTPPRDIAATTATLTGRVVPNAGSATFQFEFGRTTAYGETTAVRRAGGVGFRAVSFRITGLKAGTTYHYRLLATSPFADASSRDATFRTAPKT